MTRRIPALLLLSLAPALLHASAIRIGFKDAAVTARGNAFAATADTPAAVYYNPAGLTQIEGQAVSATAYFIQLESDYTSPLGSTSSLKREFKPVPQLYYAWSPSASPWAFGLGAYAPFGLSSEWSPSSSGFGAIATKSELTTYSLAGIAAYEIAPGLSIGAGPVVHRADVSLRRAFTPVNEYFLEGDGQAVGFSAGIRWQPSERHAFGLSYQHSYSVKLKGATGIAGILPSQAADTRLQFPEIVIVGYSFRPAPGWNLEVNVDWTNWDRVNELSIRTAPPLADTMPFNWRSSFYYDAGITREFASGFSVSAGYTFAENSIPDSTYTPAIPDSDRHIVSCGIGYRTERVAIYLNYQYAWSPDRTVTGSPSGTPGSFPSGQTADGTYRNRYHAISTSFSYEF